MKKVSTKKEKVELADVRKALIIPINSKLQILIQDRRGYKKPDWGYFGGSIENGETPIQAVIRETKEELDIDIKEEDLKYLCTSETDWDGQKIIRYMYLYPTEQVKFNVKEGRGGLWLNFEEARKLLNAKDRFDEFVTLIKKTMEK
ncbi:MAG: NUDIX hydrolase [Patescibacteria group bacterium]